MSGLILPNKWTSQPQTPVGIDWSNPITLGLAGLFDLVNGRDLIDSSPPTTKTTSNSIVNAGRIATFSNSVQIYSHKPRYAVTGALTIFTPLMVTSLTNYSGIISKSSNYYTFPFELRLGTSATTSEIDFQRGNGTASAFKGSGSLISANAGVVQKLAVRCISGALDTAPDVFVNKVKTTLARNGYSTVTGSAGDNGSVLRVGNRFDSVTYLTGGMQYLGLWNRALSDAEILSLSDNPWQIFKSQSRRIWVGGVAGGDVTLPLGFVTEADSANSITSAKSRAIGQVSESDSVIGIGASKSVTLGLNVETNQAQAVALAKSAGLGITTETDTSFALLRSKLATIGQPIEADSANAVARSKTVTLGIVVETDSAPSLGAGISIAIGQVSESDTVTGIVAVKEKSTGQTVEVESVFAISLSKTLAIGLAIETDTALSLGTATIIPIGLVVESNSATAITKVKVKAISQVIESDTVTTITSAKVASVAQVVETDTANPLLGSMVSILGLVTETEFAQSITRLKALGVLQAVEMDSVFAMNSAKTVYMSQTFEVDQVFSVFSKIDYRFVESGYNTLSIDPVYNKMYIDPNYH